tara:strand:+ start:501 stop:704 length:204 start_codon:yes stop_codon:yes gene_type:complete
MTNTSLNNTLEEELRVMLVEKNNECNGLKEHIKMLEKCVADEQEQKYRALVKAADLQSELNKLNSSK